MDYSFIRAILQGFEQLEILADLSDRRVMDIAIKSSGIDGQPRTINNDINLITELTNYKINLINLKVLVLDMVASLPYKDRLTARYRYVEGKKVNAIAKLLGLSIRSVFRILENIPKVCNEYFEILGLDDRWFLKTYSNEKWLMKLIKPKKKRNDCAENQRVKITDAVIESRPNPKSASILIGI